jgi:hypothetical protein
LQQHPRSRPTLARRGRRACARWPWSAPARGGSPATSLHARCFPATMIWVLAGGPGDTGDRWVEAAAAGRGLIVYDRHLARVDLRHEPIHGREIVTSQSLPAPRERMDHGGKSRATARQLALAHGPRRPYFMLHAWTPALATFLDHGVGWGALHPVASDLAGCSSASPPLFLCSVLFSIAGDSMRNQGELRPSRLPAHHRRPPSRNVVHLLATMVLDSGAERADGFA